MRMTLGELRSIIRAAMVTEKSNTRWLMPDEAEAQKRSAANREQLGSLAGDSGDLVAPHLTQPQESPEDCWGPVPPTEPDPYVGQDPFVRDSSPLPTPRVYF